MTALEKQNLNGFFRIAKNQAIGQYKNILKQRLSEIGFGLFLWKDGVIIAHDEREKNETQHKDQHADGGFLCLCYFGSGHCTDLDVYLLLLAADP